MDEKGEKKVQFVLFLILIMGMVFLTKGFFIRNRASLNDHRVVKLLSPVNEPEDQIIVSNVFLSFWNPDLTFIESYQPRGFKLSGYGYEADTVNASIRREKVAFYAHYDDLGVILFSEDGEDIWTVPSRDFLKSKFYSLPEIYNAKDISETRRIIEKVALQPIVFKNFLSAVDAQEKIFYLRNGNVLLVNSWNNLDMFDGKGFIYQMGKGQIYDLYSNGRYFPIIKRGE